MVGEKTQAMLVNVSDYNLSDAKVKIQVCLTLLQIFNIYHNKKKIKILICIKNIQTAFKPLGQ